MKRHYLKRKDKRKKEGKQEEGREGILSDQWRWKEGRRGKKSTSSVCCEEGGGAVGLPVICK